jgi:hypothetical protein
MNCDQGYYAEPATLYASYAPLSERKRRCGVGLTKVDRNPQGKICKNLSMSAEHFRR